MNIEVNKGELLEDAGGTQAPGLIERMAERFAAFQRWASQHTLPNVKRRRGESAMTASRRRKRSQVGRQRLAPAHGPGSINLEADLTRMIREGNRLGAEQMAAMNGRIVGARPIDPRKVRP